MAGIRLVINTSQLSEEEFTDVCEQLFDFIVELSPVDTGYFASQWDMDISYPRCTYINATPYASFLDEGWSQQAPDGITGPALDYLQDLIS